MYEFFDFDYEHAIFEWDDEDIVHIISARRATEPEKSRYEHGEDYDE